MSHSAQKTEERTCLHGTTRYGTEHTGTGAGTERPSMRHHCRDAVMVFADNLPADRMHHGGFDHRDNRTPKAPHRAPAMRKAIGT